MSARRPLAFHSHERKQHRQSAEALPFVLATSNKLINNDLRRVCEIAKLRLPDDQSVGVS